jgi:hypothetical protein
MDNPPVERDPEQQAARRHVEHRDQGNLAAARLLFERALAIRERVLGPDHPDTVATRRAWRSWRRREAAGASRLTALPPTLRVITGSTRQRRVGSGSS